MIVQVVHSIGALRPGKEVAVAQQITCFGVGSASVQRKRPFFLMST